MKLRKILAILRLEGHPWRCDATAYFIVLLKVPENYTIKYPYEYPVLTGQRPRIGVLFVRVGLISGPLSA
jgi:hypothetical protein